MKFFTTMVQSFYSPDLYRELRGREGHGLAYSFLLVLFTSFLFCALYMPQMNLIHRELFVGQNGRLPVFDDLLMQVAAQTPVMTLQNEVLKTAAPGATVIHLKTTILGEEAEGDAITIDTGGKTTYSNMQTPILVTANEIIAKDDKETRIKSFKEMAGGRHSEEIVVIDRAKARDIARQVSEFVHENISTFYLVVGGFMLLIGVGVFYFMRIIMVLLIALAGLLVANIMRVAITYQGAMRLAAVSFTPVALLDVLIPRLTGNAVGAGWLLLAGIIMFTAALTASREVPDAR